MKLVTDAMIRLPSAFDVARVATVAVALPDATVAVVDFELGTGVAADLPAAIDGIRLMIEVTGGAVGSATADIPAALGVRHHMVGAGFTLA
jgi:hypothetical protein